MPHPTLCLGLALLVLATGCRSSRTARTPSRPSNTTTSFFEAPGRSAYIDSRVGELTQNGMSPEDAAARASREWFANSSSTVQGPSYAEKKRRAAQSEFEKNLAEHLASDNR